MNDQIQQDHSPSSLKIWQQNLKKSPHTQFSMLFNTDTYYDILAMQEPNIDKFGNTKGLSHFYPIYPSLHLANEEMKRTRLVLMINKCLSSGSWSAIPVRHSDIMAVQFIGPFGTLRIVIFMPPTLDIQPRVSMLSLDT